MKQTKRWMALLLVLTLLLTFTACGGNEDHGATTTTTENTDFSSDVTTTSSADSIAGEGSATVTQDGPATTTDATTLPVSTATTKPIPTAPPRPSTSAANETSATTIKSYYAFSSYMPNVLKPELRFFAKNCSLAGIGKVVDVYVINGKVKYCITEDGSLYEVADGLFSTTNQHYRKIECEYKLARFLEHTRTSYSHESIAYLTVDGQKCYWGVAWEGKQRFEKYLLTDEYSAYVGVNNTLVWRENGTDTVVHTFPAGETVEYVSLQDDIDEEGVTKEWCTVRTNKGWYLFIKKIEYVDSGYVDVPPTEQVTYSVEKITLESSVEFYWAGAGYRSVGEAGLCIAITKDGTLYYTPSVKHYTDGSVEPGG